MTSADRRIHKIPDNRMLLFCQISDPFLRFWNDTELFIFSSEYFLLAGYYSRPFLTNKAAHRCSESPSFYQGIKIGQAECPEI